MTKNDLKLARRLSRQSDQQRRQTVGVPRAKSWGGKDSPRKDRRSSRKEISRLV